ncbi:MAG: chromosomal replication initiator protein DnaA, partial [Psychrobacter sp.]|nr:chromosomal replication initiator protein DnaA [Psychrobacter sp.]
MLEATVLWDKCLDDLKYQVKPTVFTMWLRPLSAQTEGNIFVIRAPNNYFVDYVRKNHLQDIEELVFKHSDNAIAQVVVRVDNVNSGAPELTSGQTVSSQEASYSPSYGTAGSYEAQGSDMAAMGADDVLPSGQISSSDAKSLSYLNSGFTFDTFVTGKTNNLAYKACYELTKRQSKNRHNPLFIYGPSGLGKTHLMHSVAHRYLKQNRSFYYFTSEKFINQLVYSLRNHKIEEFKKKIKKVDLLIVDDIHVLAGKVKSSNEFLSLFADFTTGDKQIILASDRHPSQLTEFDERFRSRFSWGLSVPIEPPEIDTRMQILQKKAALMGIDLPKECALFIAQNVVSNVRRLEGALNQVVANANLTGDPITLEMVQYALK